MLVKDQNELASEAGLLIYSFRGKIVYINSSAHVARFEHKFDKYSGIVLSLKDLYFIDLDGIDALEEIIEIIQKRGQKVFVLEANSYIQNLLKTSSKVFDRLEADGLVFKNLDEVLIAESD